MNLILVIAIPIIVAIFSIGIVQTVQEQYTLAKKHHEDSKADTTTTTDSKSDVTTDVIPPADTTATATVPPTTAPPIISQAVNQPCSNVEDKSCTATVAPTPPTTTPSITTPAPTLVQQDLAQALQNSPLLPQDNSGSSDNGGGSSSTSGSGSDSELIQDKQDQIDPNDPIGDSQLVIMQQEQGVGLYRVISADQTELNTNILPQTIRLIKTFDNMEEAISSIQEHDSRQEGN